MLRGFAIRFGFGALGAVYVALGIVSARVALVGARRRDRGMGSALRFLLDQPHGAWILGAVVAGLAAIAIAHLVEAAVGRGAALRRMGLAINAVGYGALAWTATRLLLHVREEDASLPRAGVSWLLGERWGPAALEIVGAAVAAGGLWELWQGLRGRLTFRRDLLPRRLARLLAGVARFGLAVRGLLLAAVGYFIVRAAEELDPARVRTMSGALRSLSHAATGPILAAVLALGLAAYGVHLWTLALLKRRV
ncbi:MAG: DUF1206 domain-containing protein [Syntrophomonadaceae bacterium]